MPRLFVDIEARFAQFQDALDKVQRNTADAARNMERAFDGLKTVFATLGVTIGAGSFVKFTLDVIKADAALVDLSASTGASVEGLSKLRAIGQLGGQSFEDLTGQIGLMVKGLKSGNEEGQRATYALKFLGVQAKNTDGSFRDTSVILTDVARALSRYADDGNKVALVQDALGKGAQRFIPYLKDIVDFGDQNARVTAAQALQAKEFETSINRLKQALEDSQRAIAVSVAPTLAKFLEQMAEGTRIAGSFGAALRIMGTIDPGPALQENLDRAKRDLEDWQKAGPVGRFFQKPLGSAYADVENDIKKRIEFLKYMQRQQALERSGPEYLDARDLQARQALQESSAYQSPDLEQNKLFIRAQQQLEEELGRINEQSKEEIVLNRLLEGSWKSLSNAQAVVLLNRALQYDERQNRIKVIESEYGALTKLIEREEALNTLRTSAFLGAKRERDDAEFQLELIGKSALEQERLNAARRIDLATRDSIREQTALLPEDPGPGQLDAIVNAAEAAGEARKRAMIGLIEARQKAERDWLTGAKTGFQEYIDDATNAARQAHDLFTNAFRGMENALVSFVKTGKLDFRSLADSILTDLIRIQIQQNITSKLAAAFGGSDLIGAIGGALGFGGARAGGGDVYPGNAYLVGERGPEVFVPGSSGSIVPNGGGGDVHLYLNAPNGLSAEAMGWIDSKLSQVRALISPAAVAAVRGAYASRGVRTPA